MRIPGSSAAQDLVAFDDGSVVVVTESALDGHDPSHESNALGREIWADLSVVYRVIRVVSQTALARISCVWLRCRAHQKITIRGMFVRFNGNGRNMSFLGQSIMYYGLKFEDDIALHAILSNPLKVQIAYRQGLEKTKWRDGALRETSKVDLSAQI
ncbi:hypothetical protein L1049_022995 [Liquidambar formosana]|uniref:Uncharacterized protein n=1 Tax=Liquidambar formosana TaxID=63359 RepID=A0AAP0RDB6_LIQFO